MHTHSLTPSLTHSLTHSLTLTHTHTPSLTRSFTLSPSLTHSFTHSKGLKQRWEHLKKRARSTMSVGVIRRYDKSWKPVPFAKDVQSMLVDVQTLLSEYVAVCGFFFLVSLRVCSKNDPMLTSSCLLPPPLLSLSSTPDTIQGLPFPCASSTAGQADCTGTLGL